MEIIETSLPGVVIIKPRVFADGRGYFFESYNKREFDRLVAPVDFVQDNESLSVRGVVRGLHFQLPPYSQAKLVRCVRGAVLDVNLDLRVGSPTYGRYEVVELSEENKLQLYVPRGFAHGFTVLSPQAVFQYKCDNFYVHESEGGIHPLDPDLNIDWRVEPGSVVLSDKDRQRGLFRDFVSPFKYDE